MLILPKKTNMNIIERAKNILTTPKTEWEVINTESATPMSLLTGYVMLLALIPAVAGLLGSVLFAGRWSFGMGYALTSAIISYVISIVAYFVLTYAIDLLANSFDSQKDINKSAQVAAYASTASYIAGALNFIPFLGLLVTLGGAIYAGYLIYLGIGPLKKTPEDKKVVYTIVAIIINIAAIMIIGAILGAILLTGLFAAARTPLY
jgi:Yip1 domain